MANTTSNRRCLLAICFVMCIYFVRHSPWCCVRIWPWESRSVNKGTSFLSDRKAAGFVSLSKPFNQHCGTGYLRSFLNVFRYNDQTLLSSMRFVYDVLPLRPSTVCWHGEWWRNRDTWVPRGFTFRILRPANAGSYMKNILYALFSHFAFTETHRW